MFRQDNTCPALLVGPSATPPFAYGAITLYGAAFQPLWLGAVTEDGPGCSRFARRYSGNLS